MATINFSVPEDLKREFQETFRDENKSAIIADLMRRALEEHRRKARRSRAIDALLDLRWRQDPVPASAIAEAREDVRE